MLITLFLVERSVLPAPLLYLSAFFEEYYDRLRGVSERSEWEAWLEYFFKGVARRSTTLSAAWSESTRCWNGGA